MKQTAPGSPDTGRGISRLPTKSDCETFRASRRTPNTVSTVGGRCRIFSTRNGCTTTRNYISSRPVLKRIWDLETAFDRPNCNWRGSSFCPGAKSRLSGVGPWHSWTAAHEGIAPARRSALMKTAIGVRLRRLTWHGTSIRQAGQGKNGQVAQDFRFGDARRRGPLRRLHFGIWRRDLEDVG